MESDSVKHWVQKGLQKLFLPILGALTMSAAERKSATTAPPLQIHVRRRTTFSKDAQASTNLSLTAATTFAPSSKKKTSSTSSSPLRHSRMRRLIFLCKLHKTFKSERSDAGTNPNKTRESKGKDSLAFCGTVHLWTRPGTLFTCLQHQLSINSTGVLIIMKKITYQMQWRKNWKRKLQENTATVCSFLSACKRVSLCHLPAH